MTTAISSDNFDNFRSYLSSNGYAFEDRPHQHFLARKSGIVINLYTNGKIVLGGADQVERVKVEKFLGSLGAKDVVKVAKEYAPITVSGTRIGTDEVGKGDYFGPLVIGGVVANELQIKQLESFGIKDSKTLSDTTIQNLAVRIRQTLPSTQYDVVVLGPLKYNVLQKEMGNVNGVLGWGHARVIENLFSQNPSCDTAVADQFGNQIGFATKK